MNQIIVTVQTARQFLRRHIDSLIECRLDAIIITRYGRKVVVLISYDKYKEIQEGNGE